MAVWPFNKEAPPLLPPRARAVLYDVKDPAQSDALAKVLGNAGAALEKIAALDVLRRDLPRGPHEERALLEAARPAAAASIEAAHALVEAVQAAYPEPEGANLDFDMESDTRPDGPPLPREAADPGDAARAVAWGIAHESERMETRLERPVPTTTEETWSHVVELQEFRGKLRTGVGELIYQVCAMHAPVMREDVVPGYRERLLAALELRKGVARFTRLALPICERVKAAEAKKLGAALIELQQAVVLFCDSRSFPSLRMSDRKLTSDFKEKLARLVAGGAKADARPAEVAEDLARFLEGLGAISRREVLKLHDAEAIEDGLRYAAAAERDAVRAPHRAEAEFFLASRVARRLEGMDAGLDAYLGEAEHWPDGRPPNGVPQGAARLRAVLEAASPVKQAPPPEDDDSETTTPGVGGG